MNNALAILAQAIADVGYWRWWTADLPSFFQVEFGGTQLWSPARLPDQPPSGLIALRFEEPTFVAFLTRSVATDDALVDWPRRLHRDEIEPFDIGHGEFMLSTGGKLDPILNEASQSEILVGTSDDAGSIAETHAVLAFWAGEVGLAVAAHGMSIFNWEGEVAAEEIEAMHAKWWEYWQEYWRRRDSDDPLPVDYACEVTIPAR